MGNSVSVESICLEGSQNLAEIVTDEGIDILTKVLIVFLADAVIPFVHVAFKLTVKGTVLRNKVAFNINSGLAKISSACLQRINTVIFITPAEFFLFLCLYFFLGCHCNRFISVFPFPLVLWLSENQLEDEIDDRH